MKLSQLAVTLSLSLWASGICAQNDPSPKKGMLSFGIGISDYNFLKRVKDSSLNYAMNQKDLFKSGNTSLGLQISYWRHIIPHIDLSGNLGGDISNFPAMFVKGDSIGQAGLSTHLDVLLHFKLFNNNARVNPFLTGGVGGGYFGKQPALYAPLGTGLEFHFNAGGVILLQMQMRKALSSGISNDFMYYSIGFARQGIFGSKLNKHPSRTEEALNKELSPGARVDGHGTNKKMKKSPKENGTGNAFQIAGAKRDSIHESINKDSMTMAAKVKTVVSLPDADGDGVPDKDDKCPDVKGSKENNGCPFPVVEGAAISRMSADSATYIINFEFDESTLQSGTFAVLNRILEILKADKSLKINITGHADSQGTDLKNRQVSAERANVTREYFLSYNISPSRITSSYYGATRPMDKVQQWRNRRVEITIIRK